MKSNNNEINQSMNKRATFFRFMRYMSTLAVTIILIAMTMMYLKLEGFDLDWALFCIFIISIYLFFITLPIIGFWIYSFIKSIKRQTKADKNLLYFHIVDLFLLVLVIYLGYHRPEPDYNAKIMAQHYDTKGTQMRNIANYERNVLPNNTRLVIEFGENGGIPQADYLNEQHLKILKNHLDDVDCIGIDIVNTPPSYTAFRFRRKGMESYLFRLYNEPLTREQQDSLRADESLIVYNDSTLFEFRGGVISGRHFVGKKEFMRFEGHGEQDWRDNKAIENLRKYYITKMYEIHYR